MHGFSLRIPLVPRFSVVSVIVNTLISDDCIPPFQNDLLNCRPNYRIHLTLQAAAEYAKILAQRQKEAKEAKEQRRKRSASLRESRNSVKST